MSGSLNRLGDCERCRGTTVTYEDLLGGHIRQIRMFAKILSAIDTKLLLEEPGAGETLQEVADNIIEITRKVDVLSHLLLGFDVPLPQDTALVECERARIRQASAPVDPEDERG